VCEFILSLRERMPEGQERDKKRYFPHPAYGHLLPKGEGVLAE